MTLLWDMSLIIPTYDMRVAVYELDHTNSKIMLYETLKLNKFFLTLLKLKVIIANYKQIMYSIMNFFIYSYYE